MQTCSPGVASPDRSACVHCGEPISWDEVCYTHDTSGFADCGLKVQGGRGVAGILIDPKLVQDREHLRGFKAEPVEWLL